MRPLLAALALVVLTACGGSSGAKEPPPPITTARMLAIDLNCTGVDDASDTPDKVSCEFNNSFLGITTYDSEKALKTDASTATSLNPNILVNNNELWMIDAPDAATIQAAQEIVGGKIP